MNRRLPSHPDIEYYRKQAKTLLKAFRAREESAVLRIGKKINGSEVRLANAQGTAAHEAGFSSWAALKTAIEEKADTAKEKTQIIAASISDTGISSRKQRYENDPNVQRWLRAQGFDDGESFGSSFLSNQHERDWIASSLGAFHAEGLIADVVGAVKAGKEATVYRCTTSTKNQFLAAKVYRPRMFRNLQNDAIYRENRMPEKDRRSSK